MRNTNDREQAIRLSKEQQSVLMTLFVLGVRRIAITAEGKILIASCKNSSSIEGTILCDHYPLTQQFCFANLRQMYNSNTCILLEEVIKEYCSDLYIQE